MVRPKLVAGSGLVAGLLLGVAALGGQEQAPYKRAGERPLAFRGPGREAPEPDVADVVLGWFGPGDPDHPDFGDFWRGALLAVEAENVAGGYRGKAFRLVPGWSESPWTAGVVEVTRMAYEHGAWAVIGGVDGASTHLAEQVALKARFALLSPGSTDVTANLANVPWLFSLAPSDEAQAGVLAGAVAAASGGEPFVVAAGTDHDAHAALVALRRELAARRLTPATLLEFAAPEADVGALAERLLERRPRAVVVIAPSRGAGRLVADLRLRGFHGTIVGGATLGRGSFRRAAGSAVEGVVTPLLRQPGPAWDAFVLSYRNRWGEAPDDAAGHGYDAVRLAAAAVRQAGLNRARIGDALRALAPWAGAAGVVRWDALGRNRRPVVLGEWRGGELMPVDSASGLMAERLR